MPYFRGPSWGPRAEYSNVSVVLGSVGSISVVLGSVDRFGSTDIPFRSTGLPGGRSVRSVRSPSCSAPSVDSVRSRSRC
eukprot:2417358-Alexandrium_andersonii.AAC.1